VLLPRQQKGWRLEALSPHMKPLLPERARNGCTTDVENVESCVVDWPLLCLHCAYDQETESNCFFDCFT
jgi:hypothetical protein